MSHNIITLDPAQAGETILELQDTLMDFNHQIHEIGVQLIRTAAITYSAPLTKALGQAAQSLNNIGQGVNAAVYAFSHAFVRVIEEWKKTDAQQAASITFKRTDFESLHLRLIFHKAHKLHVSPYDMLKVIDAIEEGDVYLNKHFDKMDMLLLNSTHYWMGESAEQTRHSWKRHVKPLQENTTKTIQNVSEMMREELQAFMNRDSQNFPGKW
jgi:hypothetical protein